jgi:hypothetical protein
MSSYHNKTTNTSGVTERGSESSSRGRGNSSGGRGRGRGRSSNGHNGQERNESFNGRSRIERDALKKAYEDKVITQLPHHVKNHSIHPGEFTQDDWLDVLNICIEKENNFRDGKRGFPIFNLTNDDKMDMINACWDYCVVEWEKNHVKDDSGVWHKMPLQLFIQNAVKNNDGSTVLNDRGHKEGMELPGSVRSMWVANLGVLVSGIEDGHKFSDRVVLAKHGGEWGTSYVSLNGPLDDKNKDIKLGSYYKDGLLTKQLSTLVALLDRLEKKGTGVKLNEHPVTNKWGNLVKTFIIVNLSECGSFGDQIAGFLLHVLTKVKNLKGSKMYSIDVWKEKKEQHTSAPKSFVDPLVANNPFGSIPLEDDEDNDVSKDHTDETNSKDEKATGDNVKEDTDDKSDNGEDVDSHKDILAKSKLNPANRATSYASRTASSLKVDDGNSSDNSRPKSVQAPDHKHKRIMNPKANAKSKDKGGSEYQKSYGLPQLTLGSMASIVFTGDNV